MRNVMMLAMLAAVAVAGCGSGGSGGSGGIANFVGTWDYSGGTIAQACPGAQTEVMNLPSYSVTITRTGNPGELQFVSNFDGCVKFLNVAGNTASIIDYLPPCGDRAADSNGELYTLTITPVTETLTYRGGNTMSENASNSLRYLYDDNTYTDCTSTISNASLF